MASELRRPSITATCSPVPRSAPSRSSAPCGEHFSRRRLSERPLARSARTFGPSLGLPGRQTMAARERRQPCKLQRATH